MDGEKNILIFSDAGGTGRSYHAAQTAKNQKRRRHYLLEPGWRADAAIQGLGRTHRSAQVSAPYFRVCTSDVHGEKRETGSQGMFREEDNLESPIARSALRGYYADLAAGRAEAMDYETFTDWTALRLIDKDGVLLEELPPIQRFLNRVLALPIHMQGRGHAGSWGGNAARRDDQTGFGRGSLDLPAIRCRDTHHRIESHRPGSHCQCRICSWQQLRQNPDGQSRLGAGGIDLETPNANV